MKISKACGLLPLFVLGSVANARASAQEPERWRVTDYPGVSLSGGIVTRLQPPPNAREPFSIRIPMSDPELKELTLSLVPISLRGEGYQLVEHRADGSYVAVDPGPERTYTGIVSGVEGSRVAASLLQDGLSASIFLPDGSRHFVEPLVRHFPGAAPGEHVVYRDSDTQCEGGCGTTELHRRGVDTAPGAEFGSCAGGVCLTDLACDADFEYYTAHGSSSTTVQDDIGAIINVMNHQYVTEVNISHVLTTILVRTSEPDPYSATDSGALLVQFRDFWNANHGGITRDTAHLFTGKDLDGGIIGIAYLTVICDGTFGYGLSQSDFSGAFACKTDLTAHELGHNWSAGHCTCTTTTMNPFITCTNTFIGSGSSSVSEIDAHRDTRACLTNGGVPPANNTCDTPTLINGSTSIAGNTTGATSDGASTCGFMGGEDLFYVFTPAATGTVSINTCGSAFDTLLSVHSGCPATTANEVACNDDHFGCGCPGALDSCLSFTGFAGTTYYLRVGGYGFFPGNGAFALNITLPTVPNDACGSAITLSDGAFVTGGLTNAGNDGSASCGGAATNRDAWYQFTAPCNGTLDVDTCGTHDAGGTDTGMDTVVSLHSACPGTSGNELDCNDDWPFGSEPGACTGLDGSVLRDSAVRIAVSDGQNVKIRVSHFGSRSLSNFRNGMFQLQLDFVRSDHVPVINAIGNTSLPCNSGTYTGPTPTLTDPTCMAPVTWSLVTGPAGMTINPSTGVVSWPSRVGGTHTVTIQAANAGGSDTESWTVDVEEICPHCPGDGSVGDCPCFNNGSPGRGCQNSIATGGALLTATGNALLASDNVVFTSSFERPTSTTIFLQGNVLIAPFNFGDGLRCAGGTLKRLYAKVASGGVATAPAGADPTVSARSAALGDPISPGTFRYYVAYYRDPDLSFCSNPPGSTFNSSSGLSVRWN